MADNMIEIVHNVETGEKTEVALDKKQIETFLTNRAEQEKINAELETKMENDKLAKEALLTKLGISAEEAKLLLS